ncbi:MAG TPA: MarR family transcriptional regulator [Deltaproteobacteria bacterium]|nr:MarR family transcriptional regulator [Deltaproteobacteria bacterium]
MPAPGSASELRLFFLLQQAAHHLKREADRVLLDADDLTTAQAAVLLIVSGSRSITQKEVARKLRLKESAMTAMIGRLEGRGLLARVPDPEDARARLVSITPSGRKALDRARRPFAKINARLDAALGRAGAPRFARDLEAILDAFRRDE